MTQPQYSSPPLVRSANSSSEILSRSVVSGRIWRIQPDSALQTALAVFVKRDLHLRRDAVLPRLDEFVADLPELALRLFDQALHAAAGVQQDGDLHERLFGALRRVDFSSRLRRARTRRASSRAKDVVKRDLFS